MYSLSCCVPPWKPDSHGIVVCSHAESRPCHPSVVSIPSPATPPVALQWHVCKSCTAQVQDFVGSQDGISLRKDGQAQGVAVYIYLYMPFHNTDA